MEMANVDEGWQLADKFRENLEEFKNATKIMQPNYREKLLSNIEGLAAREDGLQLLFDHAVELEKKGFFRETPWEDISKLEPFLVNGTLKSGHPSSTYETVNELRMLRYASGKAENKNLTQQDATDYIEQVLVHNLDLLFRQETEEMRESMSEKELHKAHLLLQFLVNNVSLESTKERLAEEVEMMSAQRPTETAKIREILKLAKDKLKLSSNSDADSILTLYIQAAEHPTKTCREMLSSSKSKEEALKKYDRHIANLDKEHLESEAKRFGNAINRTGLVSDFHVVLVKQVYERQKTVLSKALGLNSTGRNDLNLHYDFVKRLIENSLTYPTRQTIYGLGRLLERGLLSQEPVMNGLKKLMGTPLHPDVATDIRKAYEVGQTEPANQILLAGVINLLGHPLGIGQGMNPTCQAARGISLWSQHAPGKLLNMIITTAKSNNLEFRFEGDILQSNQLGKGLVAELDYNLDPVSIVLVPHLDKIYNEMMRRASGRGEDAHKWVNPALYGHWIQTGFVSAFDTLTQMITKYDEFVRTFYASHHPEYNGGHDLLYPNPVGIFITSAHAKLVGFHAVSILRVAADPEGEMRVYFLNPNNEGRQNWGQNIKPSVLHHGERAGESSLPIHEFASRLYAFHYNQLHIGDTKSVNNSEVKKVTRLAKDSWGKSYTWN